MLSNLGTLDYLVNRMIQETYWDVMKSLDISQTYRSAQKSLRIFTLNFHQILRLHLLQTY